jgi:hypothetical protein
MKYRIKVESDRYGTRYYPQKWFLWWDYISDEDDIDLYTASGESVLFFESLEDCKRWIYEEINQKEYYINIENYENLRTR